MPYRKEQFINGEIYHIVLRAIDDNEIFKDIDDYFRGIFSVYEFNNTKPINIRDQRRLRKSFKKTCRNQVPAVDARDKLVEILVFCFMPNHIHLLVKQLKDKGISKFIMKVAGGYSRYFNIKYGRKGHVFQEVFKAIPIKDDNQLKTIFVYIHTNPISLIEPKWKEVGIKEPDRVIKFLEEEYRWSSYFDYIGKKNFPSVTERDFFLKVMGGEQSCKDAIENWVRYKGEIKEFANLALE